MTRRKQAPNSGSIRRSDVDPDAVRVIEQLRHNGYEAYLVGGCVRDLYLHRRPKDFDVATNATPEQIRSLFRNSRIIGRRFTIVHVYFGSKIIETATFRRPPKDNGDDDDNLIKHDNEWGTIEDDAKRRDFTINGLFYDINTHRIVDSVQGIADLDRGVIRTIGNPQLRFEEDPVRMIRAIKFAARLDFVIGFDEWEAIQKTASDIEKCSRARVLEEIFKLLRSSASARSFALMQASGMLDVLWPSYVQLYRGLGGLRRDCDRKGTQAASYYFWHYLNALDEFILETRQVPPNGILLALLFAPLIPEAIYRGGPGQFSEAIVELMKEPCVTLGVARRDRELAQDVLESYRRIRSAPAQRRRRAVVQRRLFNDALVFLGLVMSAQTDEEGRELRAWQKLALNRDTQPRERSPRRADSYVPGSGRKNRSGRRGGRGRRGNV